MPDIPFFGPDVAGPATRAQAVTPSDTVALPFTPRAIWVGTGGNIRVTTVFGDDVTFPGVPSGYRLDQRCTRIWATGTTAAGLVIMQ